MSKPRNNPPAGETEALSRAKKAAETRARNKLAQEAKDALELQKPKVPRDAKVKAVSNAVWLKKNPGQVAAPARKRAASETTPANLAKKTKKDNKAASKASKKDGPRQYSAPALDSDSEQRPVIKTVTTHHTGDEFESASSEEEQAPSDDDECAEAEILELDDEQLMSLAPQGLASALESEAPMWQGGDDDTSFDPALHIPSKYRRKFRSSSRSSFDSSYVSLPEDADSDVADDMVLQSHPQVIPVANAHAAQPKGARKGTVKPSTNSVSLRAASAAMLFDNDDDIIDARPEQRHRYRSNTAYDVLSQPTGIINSSLHSKSKRQLAHESEAPRWRETAEDQNSVNVPLARHAPSKTGSSKARGRTTMDAKQDDLKLELPDLDVNIASDITTLVYNVRGSLNLTAQTREIREVLRIAIDIIEVGILMVNAYPDIGDKTKLALEACVDAARELGDDYLPILHKLMDKREKRFRKALADLPAARVSLLRSEVYKAAVAQVPGSYGLALGDGEFASNLLREQRYIFAGDHQPGGRLNYREPYRHPAVHRLIHQVFFAKGTSFGPNHLDLFTSSRKDLADEPEVPMAMIHAAIEEWTSGTVIQADFSGSKFASIYAAHIQGLEHVQHKTPNLFHETMVYLFQQARGTIRNGRDLTGNNAIALMDLSGLD
ncbi:hypothetical protein NEOLEDRAFT_1182049 [Neolentinus lepideus HHB14362 ss-1]|uniref:DUF6532 domain-containing protein n=1 Tax=Neolentinus lepideus HHB14362 ss-1 TaxID=1314782 RepID=A0A165PFE2_9AGAM|nr:hypothetical protein NEOLEDRAFT_1182049 [Neolentinus lepideus HHB14362 ss-1]